MSQFPIFQEITTLFQYIIHTILECDFHNLIHLCRNLTEIQEHTTFALLNLHRLLAGKVESLLHLLVSERQEEALIVNKRVSRLYRFVLFIGRWSLIDVYVVIIMSSIVKIGNILNIEPGFAIICFCSVVIITVFSAEAFDERLIWNKG